MKKVQNHGTQPEEEMENNDKTQQHSCGVVVIIDIQIKSTCNRRATFEWSTETTTRESDCGAREA